MTKGQAVRTPDGQKGVVLKPWMLRGRVKGSLVKTPYGADFFPRGVLRRW